MQGRQNAAGCIGMLERSSFFSEGASLCGEDNIFLQDNAAIHTARRSKDLFRLITSVNHPLCSPDQNPIENLWGRIARDVYKNETQFEKVSALSQVLFTTRRYIPYNLMQTLLSSMPHRIVEVINKNSRG